MNIKQLYLRFQSRLTLGLHRFPVSIAVCLLALCAYIFLNHADLRLENDWAMFWYGLPIHAMLLSCMLELWIEERKPSARFFPSFVLAIFLLVALDLLLVYEDVGGNGIGMFAISVLLGMLAFMISFWRDKDDMPLWNFTWRTFVAIIISAISALGFMAGAMALLASVEMLFNLDLDHHLYIDIVLICWSFIFPVVLLLLIPSAEKKHDSDIHTQPRALLAIVHWLYIPLLVGYLVVLWVYGAKILFTWQLPQGAVAWPVSILIAFTVVLLCVIYPSRFHADRRLDHLVQRWLPLLVLPLNVLMTIGICRRLSDYGITLPRLYVLTFNIWSYAACYYLFWHRRRRIFWVPLSLSVVFLLTSVGPWQYSNIVLRSMKNDVKTLVSEHHGPAMPLQLKDTKEWLAKQDSATVERFTSQMRYLYHQYGYAALTDLADSATITSEIIYFIHEAEIPSAGNICRDQLLPDGTTIDVHGYSMLTELKRVRVPFTLSGDTVRFMIKSQPFQTTLTELRNVEDYPDAPDRYAVIESQDAPHKPVSQPRPFEINNGPARLIPSWFMLDSLKSEIVVYGMLLTK